MSSMPIDELSARLRTWASGVYASEAAVELLIAHEQWLRREDFQQSCVERFRSIADDEPMAAVDWEIVPHFLRHRRCSSSEGQILTLASSIAGMPTDESLRELITGLDRANVGFVLQALAQAAGWHRRGLTLTVTGHPGVAERRALSWVERFDLESLQHRLEVETPQVQAHNTVLQSGIDLGEASRTLLDTLVSREGDPPGSSATSEAAAIRRNVRDALAALHDIARREGFTLVDVMAEHSPARDSDGKTMGEGP